MNLNILKIKAGKTMAQPRLWLSRIPNRSAKDNGWRWEKSVNVRTQKREKDKSEDDQCYLWKRGTHPQLYKTWGIMSMPVLGSTIDRKLSSMIVRATANLVLHSAFSANRWAEWTFWSSRMHLRSVHEKPSTTWLM